MEPPVFELEEPQMMQLDPIIEEPEVDSTPEPIRAEPAVEPVEVPAEQDDTASSVLSSEPASNIMPTPTFGQTELFEKFPRNDTQDFRVVCDSLNLRSRREVAVAFEFLLQGLSDAPPKISAEQEEFKAPIDVRRN